MYEELKEQAKKTTEEICDKAGLKEGNILVVGCSSSEICGDKIGSNSNLEVAKAVFSGIYEVLESRKIYLAAQCCEHLNRAIIVERAAVPFSEIVNVVPQPKADGGIDIGGTLIGMHIKKVAVPVRLENNKIGEANVLAARTRPKFIGGCRAVYDESIE